MNAEDLTQEGQTNIESEQAFKRFVELDAERTWRSEVQQFLDPSSDASSCNAEVPRKESAFSCLEQCFFETQRRMFFEL